MRVNALGCSFLWILVSTNLGAQSTHVDLPTDPPNPIPQYEFHLGDRIALPLSVQNAAVSAAFQCGSDNTIYFQMVTFPRDGAASGDLALYGVRSGTDLVRFEPGSAMGYKPISPIMRYFAAHSEVVALAKGVPLEKTPPDTQPDADALVDVLLIFNLKGELQSSSALDAGIDPEQVAAFGSGDLLLVSLDKSRQQMRLLVTNSKGGVLKELRVFNDDPAKEEIERNGESAFANLQIYPYGDNLLLVPRDTKQPIFEVNEAGVVRTYKLHFPKGYERGLPISLAPRSWKPRVMTADADKPVNQSPANTGLYKPTNALGLEALQNSPGAVLEFDPTSGDVLRQVNLPRSGLQPACENNGDFLFIDARASDGKLEIAKAEMIR